MNFTEFFGLCKSACYEKHVLTPATADNLLDTYKKDVAGVTLYLLFSAHRAH